MLIVAALLFSQTVFGIKFVEQRIDHGPPNGTVVLKDCLTVSSTERILLISKSTIEVLHGSQREDLVRQCTCQEMTDCYDSSKMQAIDCFNPCWTEISATSFEIASNPAALKVCFDKRQGFITEIINCFKVKIKACASDPVEAEHVKVKNYDYLDMIHRVEVVVDEQIQRLLASVTSKSMKNVMDAGSKLAKCVKRCFIAKNHGGFCFDKLHCQPKISDRNAKAAIRQCSRQVSWKTEIAELCKCSSGAGVSGLSDYCGMLTIMG